MKKPMTFLKARAMLKELSGGEFRSIEYKVTEGYELSVDCVVYAAGYSYHSGRTWDEALYSLACAMYPEGVYAPEVEDVSIPEATEDE